MEFTQREPVEMNGNKLLRKPIFLQALLPSLFVGNCLHTLLIGSEDGGSTFLQNPVNF
jgi:hypothetical protein